MDSRNTLRLIASLALAAATFWVVLNGLFFVLRNLWDAYAAVEPQKAYSLSMLFVRLLIFSATIAATSVAATLVSRDRRTPWIAGIILLAVSIPDHLYPGYVWDDYPTWYHTTYLVSVIPLAVMAGLFASRTASPTAVAQQSAAVHR